MVILGRHDTYNFGVNEARKGKPSLKESRQEVKFMVCQKQKHTHKRFLKAYGKERTEERSL